MRRQHRLERDRSGVMTLGVLALTVIGIAIILILGRPRQTKVAVTSPRPTGTPEPTATPSPVTVHVSGAVARPNQTYTLPPNSRVEAAIAAAGGALPGADLSRVNLADLLRDGAQIHVPSGQVTAPPATPIGGVKINVNIATAAELDTLPGIGPALAQRIVDYRTRQGAFVSVDDLDKVSGIGPTLIEQLRDFVRFN
ncbi:MAG: ComEA family DNA-binding protein [Chloroflexi bacterium]|nr:ComEA family DNA-binding protein [Chloroflexota bacterium]